ncbi:MAG: four helix bundle protein [bacterium]
MENKIKVKSVEDFIVYQKAMKLFDEFIKEDLPVLSENFAGKELARQQIRSLDSICANMEEGYGRKAGKELKQFFRISRGSAGESKGRYIRCTKFLPAEIINKRVAQLDEIQAMLYTLVSKVYD